jgi:hypothetical protein
MTYYLYIKTHQTTRLKYLGYTTHNPYTYSGSGIDWKTHCQTYGKNLVSTEIILETNDWAELTSMGRYYSRLWKITTAVDDFGNKIWANRIVESGGGSSEMMKKFSNSPEERERRRIRSTEMHSNPEFKKLHRQRSLEAARVPGVQERKRASMKVALSSTEAKDRRSKQVGKLAPRYDNTVYVFEHLSGTIEHLTRQDMIHKYSLSPGAISGILSGDRKSHKGWKLSMKKAP